MIELDWNAQQVSLARGLTQVRAERGSHGTPDEVLRTNPYSWSAIELLGLKRLQEKGFWDAKPKLWIERAEIDLLFAKLIVNLHPDGPEVQQALASGVNPAKLATLYAGDNQPIAAEIRERLRHMNMKQYKDLRGFITQLSGWSQGKLRTNLNTERQLLPESVVALNVRLSKQRNEAIKGTYASEVNWLPELISDMLGWVELASTWQPHEQITHVWLISKLLQNPLFASR